MYPGSQKGYSEPSSTLHSRTFDPPPPGTASDIELVPHSPYPPSPQSPYNLKQKAYEGRQAPPKELRSPWKSLVFMPSFLVLAVGVGIGHHIFYSWLNGKPTDVFQPVWAIRAGTAASFLFKSFIAITISTAYIQRIWLSMRKRAFTLPGLDAMFAAVEQPKSGLFEKEMWTSAKIALLMVFSMGALPIVPVLTPTTLGVVANTNITSVNCNVPSGDLNNPTFASQLAVVSDGGFYTRPAPLLQQAVIQALTGRQVTWKSPCGTNCTYEQELPSLYLNCTDNTNTASQSLIQLTELYHAISRDLVTDDTKEAVTPLEVEWSSNNRPGIGDKRLYCIPRPTTYTVQVTYVNGKQTNTIKEHTKGTGVFGRPQPGSLGVPAKETRRVVQTAMLESVYHFLEATLISSEDGSTSKNDLISLSTFIRTGGAGQRSYVFGDVKAGLEKLMVDTSLSLFAFASDTFDPPILTQSTCQEANTKLMFVYQPFVLLVTYGAGLGIGLVCLIMGMYALIGPNQRQAGETTFSAIMASTRNETIDSYFHDPTMTVGKLNAIKFRYGRLHSGREAFGTREDFGGR